MNLHGKKVLILNQDYRALTICSVEKAFVLVYLNKAEMVAQAHDLCIHTISKTFAMPSIIRLFNYVNLPYRGVVLTRHNVFKRDGGKCQYCGTHQDLTLDHVLPRSRGGKSSWENLVTACRSCNSRKGDRLPIEAKMPLKKPPFKPTFLVFLRDYSGNIDEKWEPYLSKNKVML
jgi:5-methylcytosine-specific restriction endonuclease McrA